MYLSREFRLLLYFALGLMLGAFVTAANAGYALPSAPMGFTSSAAGYMYKAPAAVAAANAAFTPSISVNVAGKAIAVPAAMRMASNAGQFAVNAVRLNPWLAVGAVATWLATEYITYDDAQGVFVRSGPLLPAGYSIGFSPCFSRCSSVQAAIDAAIQANSVLNPVVIAPFITTCTVTCKVYLRFQDGSSTSYTITYRAEQVPSPVAAVDAHWVPLASNPLPWSAAEPIAREFPLPVQQPELSPVTAPLSEPYLDPATGQPYRDMVRVSPAPTPESPFRVRTDPYREPVASLDPDALPVTPTPEAPIESIDPKEEPNQFCEEFPDASACAELGNTYEVPDVPTQTEQVGISPVNVAPTGGTCPADKTVETQFGSIAISWGLLCQYADLIRPIVLAMAWLSAGFGFFFGARRSS